MSSNQKGFTLVELAVVLVIIGLLLGGVLKGQELIGNAKVKNLIGDFRNTATMIYGYQDKYRALPGDQSQGQLDNNFGSNIANACTPSSATCTTGNGRLDGGWNDTSRASEAFVFWQHIRLANLANGATVTTDPNYLPRNADGGQIGIESNTTPFISGMRGSYAICSSNILGRYVRQIDLAMDDGNTAGGSVQAVPVGASRNSSATASNAIVDSESYIVCHTI